MTMGELTLTYIEGVTCEWGCMLLKGLTLRLMLAKYESSTLNNKKTTVHFFENLNIVLTRTWTDADVNNWVTT